MVEDKPTTLLLPHVLRGISKQVPQRRTLDKLLLVAVTAAAIYGVSLAISSSLPSQQLVQNVIFRPSVAQAPSVPTVTSSTTPRAWRPGSTLAAQSGSNHSHFRQLSNSVVVVREGSDVQLDCRLTVKPHAIVPVKKEEEEEEEEQGFACGFVKK
ncbi:uncharacterized protein LOC119103071 [Pollicipes pollicipes]|uniref:uncharacterized protein LOC119103071 n=1 Tax=Pollicipes pollicipes TaxID=41117 RepID=UPI001884D59E|nr:uncharacterized protein LOC119103071 [Pollicipes pollicipes]